MRVEVNPYKPSFQSFTNNACGPSARERIQHPISFLRCEFDYPLYKLLRKDRKVFIPVMSLGCDVPYISWILAYRITHCKYWIVFVLSNSIPCDMTLELSITCWTKLFGIVTICTCYITCRGQGILQSE